MRGNADVIAQLNLALREELSAINQYFLHAEMCHNWGYHKLGGYIRKQSIDEMKHAEELIERLLFLDGTPKMEYMDLNVGASVKEQLEADLKLEENAVKMYNTAVKVSRDAGDDASRDLFSKLLRDEEEHVDWLEAQDRLRRPFEAAGTRRRAGQKREVQQAAAELEVDVQLVGMKPSDDSRTPKPKARGGGFWALPSPSRPRSGSTGTARSPSP